MENDSVIIVGQRVDVRACDMLFDFHEDVEAHIVGKAAGAPIRRDVDGRGQLPLLHAVEEGLGVGPAVGGAPPRAAAKTRDAVGQRRTKRSS